MAWWTHLLFFERNLEEHKSSPAPQERFSLSYLGHVLREHLHENYIDFLYLILSLLTYIYLTLSIVTFFFEDRVPQNLPYAIETLSEPYLGILGIYVVVKEIERRRGHIKQRTWGELFAIVWFLFFITASILTFFSDHYQVNAIYKTVVTNALAAVIIRIGTIIR
jgi:hypothetical protein